MASPADDAIDSDDTDWRPSDPDVPPGCGTNTRDSSDSDRSSGLSASIHQLSFSTHQSSVIIDFVYTIFDPSIESSLNHKTSAATATTNDAISIRLSISMWNESDWRGRTVPHGGNGRRSNNCPPQPDTVVVPFLLLLRFSCVQVVAINTNIKYEV